LERYSADVLPDSNLMIEFANGPALALIKASDGSLLVAGDFVGADGLAYAGALRLVPDTPATRLGNISTRGFVGNNNDVLIAGFFVGGDEPQRVVIRGVAQNLATFGVGNRATDILISVYANGENQALHESDTWYGSQSDLESYRVQQAADRIGAFPLQIFPQPGETAASTDAAMLLDLPPGGYTVHLTAATPGIGLVEVFDANGIGADRKLSNLSTRGRVGTGDERLIGGFVVDRGTKRVLIRAVGPGISSLVAGTLANPVIDLVRQSDQVTITTNDDWGDAPNAADIAAASQQVSGLQLANGSADAAILVDLPAGSYTAIVSGAGATTGIALVEVYEVP
jgi:hypothetical protein